jgi:hypothetical protein
MELKERKSIVKDTNKLFFVEKSKDEKERK